MSKQMEAQMADLNASIEESTRNIQELNSSKSRLMSENTEITRQLEEAESRVNQLTKETKNLQSQLEEARRILEEETRVRIVSIQLYNAFKSKFHNCLIIYEHFMTMNIKSGYKLFH